MTKGEIAEKLFLEGKNCSTSVVLAFKKELNLEELTLKKMAIGFGGGLGRQRLTCGAVSGMCLVLSLLLSDGENKQQIYSIIQSACEEFKKEAGSIICADLLMGKVEIKNSPVPEERCEEYYKKRPCAELCKIAGNIVERYLNK
ncbi:MAG: C_GCAxxG_C_C family protein [Firmicutes bacterium]|nr:C_GCAxxG_C_C family protein [Candidatus Caballimonas caccae]